MLAPIAWRTPPRDYGPWEQVVATLTDVQSHTAIWSGGPFDATDSDTLTLAIDATLLHAGDFVLGVERRLASGRSEPEGRFPFRVTASAR